MSKILTVNELPSDSTVDRLEISLVSRFAIPLWKKILAGWVNSLLSGNEIVVGGGHGSRLLPFVPFNSSHAEVFQVWKG
jgi:hypothetical protein